MSIHRFGASLLAIVLALDCIPASLAETVSKNPLLTPPVIQTYTQTPQRFLNILFLGIDYADSSIEGGYTRTRLENRHTDSVLLATLNLEEHLVTLLSLPRDSLTYVPGIRGIYKLNGAFNCGDTVEEGLKLTCNAVSWHLGGIEVNSYIAVDVEAMIALGNAIGGVDFDLEMAYQGSRWYKKGMQHLDGLGMMDYVRARTNATQKANDLGRTERQRKMMAAVFGKIRSNPLLVTKVLGLVQSGELNVFTNIGAMEIAATMGLFLSREAKLGGTEVLTGPYKEFMKHFTFNDQDHRRAVIRKVFGIEVPEMKFVSYEYTRWLNRGGLTAVKAVNVGKMLLGFARENPSPTAEQQAALAELEAAYDALILAFDAASESMDKKDTDVMKKARDDLEKMGRSAARQFGYPKKITWERDTYWYSDEFINERWLNWN